MNEQDTQDLLNIERIVNEAELRQDIVEPDATKLGGFFHSLPRQSMTEKETLQIALVYHDLPRFIRKANRPVLAEHIEMVIESLCHRRSKAMAAVTK